MDATPAKPAKPRSTVWFILIVTIGMIAAQSPRMMQGWRDAPDGRQRIAALLVSWGCRPPALTLPVDDGEAAARIEALKSPDGEVRVRAAHWLAEHGVRDAVPTIVSAMWSPGTGRPCQLAHSLGGLGDAGAVGDLLSAANQPGNTDLRVCAMIGLRDLASDQAVDGLLALCDDPFTASLAVSALGEIADARALPRLRRFDTESDNPSLLRAAALAMERIGLASGDDPVPALSRRVRDAAAKGDADAWAVRWLARAGDERAVAPLAAAMKEPRLDRSGCELLAAGLLAHGEGGASALREVAGAHATTHAHDCALAALGLLASETKPRAAGSP